MTSVEFHTGVADPLELACRMLRKACRQGTRVSVTAPEDTLAALDTLLWTFDACAFVPHVRLTSPGVIGTAARTDVVQRSPVWLMTHWQPQAPSSEATQHDVAPVGSSDRASALSAGLAADLPTSPASPTVLINLDGPVPDRPQALQRIIDIVGRSAEQAAQGRVRWRAYAAFGLVPVHHAAGSAGG